jgi:glycoside/pentoside/hexuronide:cation symporter, GPH family
MAMLPIYMVAPKFYSATLGVGLTAIGLTLLLVRLVDTLQDPLIGRLVDWLTRYRHGWTILLMGSAVALAAGFALLFAPTVQGQNALLLWMAGSLILVYTAHSLMNVCYLAWGARLTDDLAGRARVTAWREASGVFGVVLASVLPAIWVAQHGPVIGYRYFTVAFVLALMLGLAVTLKFSVRPIVVVSRERPDWRSALAQPAVRRLYWFYLFNATSAAIPATLILFYVDDVLQQPGKEGLFLGVYFLAGLLTLPLWVKLSDRWGKVRAWLAGSVLASLALATAAFLGSGDVLP